jgi:hypothetical protein
VLLGWCSDTTSRARKGTRSSSSHKTVELACSVRSGRGLSEPSDSREARPRHLRCELIHDRNQSGELYFESVLAQTVGTP